MTKNKYYNLHLFINILMNGNTLINTSPDYIKEKSLIYFGILGKNEFVPFKNKKHEIVYMEYWKLYCEIWNINLDEYQLLNILLFCIYNKDTKKLLKKFEKYFGNVENISNLDLKYTAHKKIIEYVDRHIDYNDRYFKLKTLQK